ncbi:IS66 family transposase [Lacticaseibacillus salsurivasis]|uniref:IS66 family transposase n=1 Tax=Lacticaseibacillus salsurivasis TaxID=3081441 RepID=UPI003F4F114D
MIELRLLRCLAICPRLVPVTPCALILPASTPRISIEASPAAFNVTATPATTSWATAWCDAAEAAPKSRLGLALTYARNQRQLLNRVLDCGEVDLSNNAA